MPISGLVFDLDGVLFDAVDLHFQALNRALRELGHPEISPVEQRTRFNGLPTRVKMKMLGITGEEAEKVNTRKQDITAEMLEEVVQVDMALVAVLQQMKDRGYRMACASNSVRRSVDAMVNGTGAAPFMEFTLSNEDVSQPKPHPEIYLLASQRLSLKPWEVLVVEDNVNGQRAALEAGCRLCVVRNPLEVTLSRLLTGIQEHEALGYKLPAPQPRNLRFGVVPNREGGPGDPAGRIHPAPR